MRRYVFDLIVLSVCAGLLGLFGWHAQKGPRSFANHERLIARAVSLDGDRNAVRAQREALEARVSLLRPETIDPDMLEEVARRVLGFVHQGDIVVR